MSDQPRKEKSERGDGVTARRRSAPWLLGGLVLVLLSILVALQTFGVWTVVPPDTASDTLLLYALSSLNFAAFLVFTFIFVRNLLKLRRERRERQLGSKIKTRLIVYFIAVSLLPITAMAIFSYLFLNRSIEKWFYRLPEDVVKEAREVQHKATLDQARNLRETASMLAALIDEQPALVDERILGRLVENGRLAAIEIIAPDGEVITRSYSQVPIAERGELEQAIEVARRSHGSDQRLTDGRGYDAVAVSLS